MKLAGLISVIFLTAVFSQDCLFYYSNSTELFTSAFVAVPENTEPGKIIARADVRIALRLSLKPVDEDMVQELFSVIIRDNISVEVVVKKRLDFLLPHTKTLNFQLQCTGPSGSYSSLPFLITILDVNDHAPYFSKSLYEANISEFHSVGIPVIDHIHARDDDLPNSPNTEIQYAIVGGNNLQYFVIANSLEGTISLQRKLDYESGPKSFKLNISATDNGQPAQSNWTSVVINVMDEDDQNPVFEEELYEVTVVEEVEEFKPILTVRAWDGDLGINESIKYDMVDGYRAMMKHFTIDNFSGQISLLKAIDREQMPLALAGYISLIVQATQENDPSRIARVAVRIYVEDINDNGPKFLNQYIRKEFDLLPSLYSLVQVDLVQLVISDRDTPENAAFVAFIESDSANVTQGVFPWRTRKNQLLILEPNEGINQSISLRAENLTALLEQVGNEISLSVMALDSVRNKRAIRSVMQQDGNVDYMQDIALVHIRFVSPFAGRFSPLDSRNFSDDARTFLTQYPVVLLIVFGSLVCILLIAIAIMAAAYHSIKQKQRVSPKMASDSTSTTNSITLSKIYSSSICSNESQA